MPKAKPKAKPPPVEPKPGAEAVEAEVMDAEGLSSDTVTSVPPPKYTFWEKVMPPAKRGKQISTMEEGSREVLSLVRSLRENMDRQASTQKHLMETLTILPEAVDSVKQLADYTGQHAEMLKLMQESHSHMGETVNRFNDTLVSMDKTTQLILERAQRSETQLSKMLRRSQRRLALMLIMMVLMFFGAAFAVVYSLNPDRTEAWLTDRNLLVSRSAPEPESPAPPVSAPEQPDPTPPSVVAAEDTEVMSLETPEDSPGDLHQDGDLPGETTPPAEEDREEPETTDPVGEEAEPEEAPGGNANDEGADDLTDDPLPVE